jgi:hypothetical protein
MVMAALLLLFAAACTGDPPLSCGEGQGERLEGDTGVPIAFTDRDVPGGVLPLSAGDLTTSNLTAMAVYAHATGTNDFAAAIASTTPNFMFNQSVTRPDAAGAWTYAPMRYWPVGNTSFFALAVPGMATGITGVTVVPNYTGYPAFTVTPPASPAQQLDLCVATALDRTETDGTVPFTFAHTMARLTFSAKYSSKIAGENLDVTIRKIEVKEVYGSRTLRFTASGFEWNGGTRGTYTLSVADGTLADNAPLNQTTATTLSTDAGELMIVPQDITEDATLKVTVRIGEWIENIHEVAMPPFSLEPGKSYNYNLMLTDLQAVWNYVYTGAAQSFTAPKDGTYQLEVWGAGGATVTTYTLKTVQSGNGGYAGGEYYLTAGETLYVYVGKAGSTRIGGWNGGGTAYGDGNGSGFAGGGATDIRLNTTAALTGKADTDPRIIVAGGGGGGIGSNRSEAENPQGNPGHGGGLSGSTAGGLGMSGGAGGTQTSGGAAGKGANGYNSGWAGSGGGGWWGGSGGAHVSWGGGGGGGGSSFIGKVTNGVTYGGGQSMPDWNNPGATMTGNTGNGHARITRIK